MENEEEWSPDKEKEPDEFLKDAQKFLKQSQLAFQKEPKKSFEEVSALLRKSWEEVKRIAPDASGDVHSCMIMILMRDAQ